MAEQQPDGCACRHGRQQRLHAGRVERAGRIQLALVPARHHVEVHVQRDAIPGHHGRVDKRTCALQAILFRIEGRHNHRAVEGRRAAHLGDGQQHRHTRRVVVSAGMHLSPTHTEVVEVRRQHQHGQLRSTAVTATHQVGPRDRHGGGAAARAGREGERLFVALAEHRLQLRSRETLPHVGARQRVTVRAGGPPRKFLGGQATDSRHQRLRAQGHRHRTARRRGTGRPGLPCAARPGRLCVCTV